MASDKVTDEELAQVAGGSGLFRHTMLRAIAKELQTYRRQAQEAPRGYDLENQKAENLGSWRLPLEEQEAPKAVCKSCDFYEGCEHEFLHTDKPSYPIAPKAESVQSYAELAEAAREARAWIDGILCQCDTTVDHVCERCVLIRSIDKALSALDEARKG